MERNFYQRFFLSYQKIISFMDVFIILQLSANDFWVRTKGGKQQHYNKLKQIRYFNVINIAKCWCEIGCIFCTSEGSVINQLTYAISGCYIFPDDSVWFMNNLVCLCDVWKGRSYLNANVSISSIFNNGQFYLKYYFLRHWSSPSKRFS